jgi:hypothetical protein
MCCEKWREKTNKKLQKNGDKSYVSAPTNSIIFSHSNEHGAQKDAWWLLVIFQYVALRDA